MTNIYPLSRVSVDRRRYTWAGRFYNGVYHDVSGEFLVSLDQGVTLGKSPDTWKLILARGGMATSVLSGVRKSYSVGDASWSYRWEPFTPQNNLFGSGSGSIVAPSLGLAPAVDDIADSAADAKARAKFLGDYLSKTNRWRGGNFLAEVAETVHMLRHPVQSLFGNTIGFANRVGSIKRLAKRNPRAYGRKLGQLWLGYAFGWKPLFDDIKDANSAISKLSDGTGHDSTKIQGNGRSASFAAGLVNAGLPAYAGPTCLMVRNSKSVKNIRYTGLLRAQPESLSTIADNFGVNATDVLPAVWEAIPWSFLIDYFVNVQEVVDSFRYASVDWGGCEVGVKNENSRQCGGLFLASEPLTPGYHSSVGGGTGKATSTAVKRGSSGVPYPGFRFKIPGMGSLKWVNISALLAAIQRSRP